jgi:hypothetical protein
LYLQNLNSTLPSTQISQLLPKTLDEAKNMKLEHATSLLDELEKSRQLDWSNLPNTLAVYTETADEPVPDKCAMAFI